MASGWSGDAPPLAELCSLLPVWGDASFLAICLRPNATYELRLGKVQAAKTNAAQFGLEAGGDCMLASYQRLLYKMGFSTEVQYVVLLRSV